MGIGNVLVIRDPAERGTRSSPNFTEIASRPLGDREFQIYTFSFLPFTFYLFMFMLLARDCEINQHQHRKDKRLNHTYHYFQE